ncbi:serine/threonine-protein kinase [Kitasatospora sp. A2-31]|uniref:serine/threonine-protein kinase n=1 Tax=Kitasatospora sp. A2-31 TaxID=2916414 RepID=UPI001EE89CA2|nr:serine/threonine-protein kinase [Kitasatospora sp. A2-31]MCG6492966.1 serine/threonine protein kinase [Kitasatospora sp. A2-31]
MQPLAADDPRQVGEYRLLRQLGAGGMGRVYLGRTPGGRTVAVKVVRPDLAGDTDFRARFRQEVAAAGRVGGAWTAPVLDADTESTHPWVATGYVAGPALASAVPEFGPLPEPAVRTLGVGLAEALAHVHGLGLVHRDVKPSNVLLTLDGPRLIDFGITRALDATTALTRSGFVVGSPGFMSPEQAEGRPAGPPSDVFSLGAVLAYAATGTMPFGSGVSAAVLLYRVLHEEPDLSGLDGTLHSAVRDCLAKDPAARPTPDRLRELLDGDGSASARLGRGDWLPGGLAAAVGRSAVQLLDLEGEGDAAVSGAAAVAAATEARQAGPPPAMPPGFGPPPGGPFEPTSTPTPFPPTPFPTPPPTDPFPTVPPSTPVSARAYAMQSRRGGRVGAVAAVLAAVLLAGGGLLLFQVLRDEDRQTGGSAAASYPARPAPGVGASGPASAPASGGTASVGPASDSPEPTDDESGPAVSAADPASGIIPAKFLGTWIGERRTAGGDATTVTLTIGQSAPGRQTSRIRTETADGATWCEAVWTPSNADESKVTYTSMVTRASGGDTCKLGDIGFTVVTVLPDGTLRYSMDLLRQDQFMVLRKKG